MNTPPYKYEHTFTYKYEHTVTYKYEHTFNKYNFCHEIVNPRLRLMASQNGGKSMKKYLQKKLGNHQPKVDAQGSPEPWTINKKMIDNMA